MGERKETDVSGPGPSHFVESEDPASAATRRSWHERVLQTEGPSGQSADGPLPEAQTDVATPGRMAPERGDGPASVLSSAAVERLAGGVGAPPGVPTLHPGFVGWLLRKGHRSFFQPLTGVWVLGLDWLIFGGNALSGGLMTCLAIVGGFLLGGVGTAIIQHHYGQEPLATSLGKGLLGGLVVGAPFPVAGTFVGGLILIMAGLQGREASSGSVGVPPDRS